MSRGMVQVPKELKETIEAMQPTFHTNTIYGVIQGLLDYYHKNEAQKAQEERYKEENMIDAGEEAKNAFVALKTDMGLQEDGDLLKVLLSHYENAAVIDKKTFALYVKCKQPSGSSRADRRWPLT